MIRLPNSTFIHIPRTGGLWLGEVVRNLGLPHQILKGDIDSHTPWSELPDIWKQGVPFSFVRHPINWIKSRWSHCLEHNLAQDYRNYGVHRSFDLCVRPSLTETMETVLECCPGIVGHTYKVMLAGCEPGFPILARTMDLPQAAWKVLRRLEGLPPEAEEIFYSIPKFNNTSDMEKYREEIEAVPAELVEQFLQSEVYALKLWSSIERSDKDESCSNRYGTAREAPSGVPCPNGGD